MSEKKRAITKLLNEDVGVAELLGGPKGSSKDFAADQLTKISDALCSVSKKEVREDLSQEFKEKLSGVATKEDLSLAVEEIRKDVHAVELRRKEDRAIVNRHEMEINEIRQQGTSNSIKLNHVEVYTKQIPTLLDSINSLHDTVNLALSSSQEKPQQAPKVPWYSKIPAPLWLAIGGLFISIAAGTATAWVYIKTGEIILFGGGQ